ncbi:hypothetical protein [Confluentibacter lentus]|uniref:hypothetical protein n=1 Tax=Confluentibacter lentus TaxID=1699412 RepID=UPI000C28A41F|nr:hypothetical protein [Confluentibacter lentus]
MVLKNKRLTAIISTVVLLLLIPLTAMQFTNEVNWSFRDFIAAALLLLGTGLAIELVLRKVSKKQNRFVLLFIILVLLFVTWVELAVGIFGTPFAGS